MTLAGPSPAWDCNEVRSPCAMRALREDSPLVPEIPGDTESLSMVTKGAGVGHFAQIVPKQCLANMKQEGLDKVTHACEGATGRDRSPGLFCTLPHEHLEQSWCSNYPEFKAA